MVHVQLVLVVAPPLSKIVTRTVYGPSSLYVCVPLIWNVQPVIKVSNPSEELAVDVEPSPHPIVAEKSVMSQFGPAAL